MRIPSTRSLRSTAPHGRALQLALQHTHAQCIGGSGLTSGSLVSHLELLLSQSDTPQVRLPHSPILRPRSRHPFGNFGPVDIARLTDLIDTNPDRTAVRTLV